MNNKSIRELIAFARGRLLGKYTASILACVTVAAINLIILMISSSNPSTDLFSYIVKITISIIINLLMGVLVFGQAHFFLKIVRDEEKPNPRLVFYGIKNSTDKAILVQSAFTIASCITLIPVVIVNVVPVPMTNDEYFRFTLILELADIVIMVVTKMFIGLSFYILSDHPEMSVKEIYSESMRIMANKKGRLFLIYLSMIPLMIVGMLACCIGLLWVDAYVQTLLAGFYLDAIGEDTEKKETTPDQDGYSI